MRPSSFDPFAELNQMSKTKATNGISVDDLARTAFDVLAKIQGCPTAWEEAKDECKESWKLVAKNMLATIDRQGEDADMTFSAKGLAKQCYCQFVAEMSAPAWASIEEHYQLEWEAVARHLANVIEADASAINITELEERIVEWARSKSAPLVLG